VKRHLRAFRNRWARKWGVPRALWKLEFQRRGVAHYHLAIAVPGGVDLVEVRQWVARSWWEVVGSGDAAHLAAGTQVDEARGDLAMYFAGYARRKSKEHQHELPPGWEGAGRWWGLWGLQVEWRSAGITARAFIVARRQLLNLRRSRSRGRRVRQPVGLSGCWQLGQLPGSVLASLEALWRLWGGELVLHRPAGVVG
jgi:hypothetical protein